MARIRNIKPKFFLDSDIGKLTPLTRLLFIGLWCLADREGRMEDNPDEIAIQIIPYDMANISSDQILNSLSPRFIVRYEANGGRYIQIRNFLKHQRPSSKEVKSEIPAPKPETMKFSLVNPIQNIPELFKTFRNVLERQEGSTEYGVQGGGAEADFQNDNDNHIDKDKLKSDASASLPLSGPEQTEPTAARPLPASPGLTETEKRDGDKNDTIIKRALPEGQYPEADILAVAAHYCEVQGMEFMNAAARAVYLKQNGMFYPAKDLLALNGGDVERTKLCLTDFSDHYTKEGKEDWNWKYVLEDFPEWDELRREYEHGTRLVKEAAEQQ